MFQQSEMCVRASVRNWKKSEEATNKQREATFYSEIFRTSARWWVFCWALRLCERWTIVQTVAVAMRKQCAVAAAAAATEMIECVYVGLTSSFLCLYHALSEHSVRRARELCVCVRRMFQSGYEYCSSIASGLSWFFCIEPNRCFSGLSRYFSAFYVEFSVVSFNLLDSLDPILVLWIV